MRAAADWSARGHGHLGPMGVVGARGDSPLAHAHCVSAGATRVFSVFPGVPRTGRCFFFLAENDEPGKDAASAKG